VNTAAAYSDGPAGLKGGEFIAVSPKLGHAERLRRAQPLPHEAMDSAGKGALRVYLTLSL
jgi:hypothetical protein